MTPLSPGLGCKTLQGNTEIHGQTARRQLTNAPKNVFHRGRLNRSFHGSRWQGRRGAGVGGAGQGGGGSLEDGQPLSND